jgi:hypothetical protein
VKIEELHQQVKNLIGQVVELEGCLLIMMDNRETAYLAATDTYDETAIRIQQPLAELRKIIQPLPTMILSHRGELIQPPYLYNFPLILSAKVILSENEKPILCDVQAVRLLVDYPPNMAEWVAEKQYLYTAEVEYNVSPDLINGKPVKAKIMSHRVLQFAKKDNRIQVLDPDANAYARLITNKTITIPGWLKYIPGMDAAHAQFVLRTFAVRAAMIGVGPLRGMTSIWWKPEPRYQVVRSHTNLARDVPDTNRRVDITGQIDYITGEAVPINGDNQPSLFFSRVDAITSHWEDYLVDTELANNQHS